MQRHEIIDAVQTATANVFSTMLGLDVTAATARTDDGCPAVSDGVMAFIGIAGPWMGSGMISCDAAFACRMCELFLMTHAPSVNEEVLDALGELTNMVVGNFKTAAEAVVGALGLSVPTVVYGRNFTFKSLGSKEWVVVPFSAGEHRFEVRIWFAPAAEGSSHLRHSCHLQAV